MKPIKSINPTKKSRPRKKEIKPDNQKKTLDELIDEYYEWVKKYEERHTTLIPDLEGVLSCLCGKKNTEDDLKNKKFRRHFHQRWIKSDTIIKANDVLSKNESSFDYLKDFDEIFDVVYNIIFNENTRNCGQEIGKIYGLGQLSIYDFTVRYAKRKNIFPTSLYLHRGVIDGAKDLGSLNIFDKNWLKNTKEEVKRLPLSTIRNYPGYMKCLDRLDAINLEVFLCLFKDKFKNISVIKF